MSGGSFNYLCHASAGTLFERHDQDLHKMVEALEALGPHATAVAQRTKALMAIQEELDYEIDALRHVWRSVEWFESCDSSREQIFVALGEYKANELAKVVRDGQDLAR